MHRHKYAIIPASDPAYGPGYEQCACGKAGKANLPLPEPADGGGA